MRKKNRFYLILLLFLNNISFSFADSGKNIIEFILAKNQDIAQVKGELNKLKKPILFEETAFLNGDDIEEIILYDGNSPFIELYLNGKGKNKVSGKMKKLIYRKIGFFINRKLVSLTKIEEFSVNVKDKIGVIIDYDENTWKELQSTAKKLNIKTKTEEIQESYEPVAGYGNNK